MCELEVKQLFETLRLRTWSSGSQASFQFPEGHGALHGEI